MAVLCVVQLFFLCISFTNLVRSDDNVAMESDVSYQETYKVHPDHEEGHQVEHYKESHGGGQNQFHINVQKLQYLGEHQDYSHGDQKQYQYQYVQQHQSTPQNEGHTTLAEVHGVEEVQPISHHQNVHQQHHHHTYQHGYQHQRPYQPTRVKGKYNSQASQVKHINEKEGSHKAIGFSSYVEHVSDKDEEAAIKEGSIGDLKKLVPKSGISFKIYHSDKHTEGQKTHQSSHTYLRLNGHSKEEDSSHNSNQHHKLKVEVAPASDHQEYEEPKGSQYYLKDQNIDHEIENIQPNIGVVGNHGHEYHSENVKGNYYTQIEGSSQKPPAYEVGGKASVLGEIKSGNHGSKPTSTVEFNKNLNLFAGHKSKTKDGFRKEITKFQYKKPQYISGAGKAQISLKKPLKHLSVAVKPTEAYHLGTELHTGEKITQSHVQHSENESTKEGLSSYISHTTGSPHLSIDDSHGVHFSHTTASPHVSLGSIHSAHQALISHSTATPLVDNEPEKEKHSSFSSQFSSHEGLEGLKNSQVYIDHTKLRGVEESKGGLHGIITDSTVGPHAALHETYSHSTVTPIVKFEAAKGGLTSFQTQLHSHEGVEHGHNYVTHLSSSQINSEEGKDDHTSYVSHSTPVHHESLESLKAGHVSYHSTAGPSIDFKSPQEEHSNYISHTTSSPHVEALSSGTKPSTPNSHISFEMGKDGYHSVISHTTAAPQISVDGSKESHISVLSHTTAAPHVSLESSKGGYFAHTTSSPHFSLETSKGGYFTHTTPKPFASFEPTKGSYLTYTTAIPHVSLESAKGGYISHTTLAPHFSVGDIKDHTSFSGHSAISSHLSAGSHGLSHTTASPILSINGGHGSVISHTTVVPHVSIDFSKESQHQEAHYSSEVDIPKLSQSHFVKHIATNTYLDSELKGNEHGIVSHVEVDNGGKEHGLTHIPVNTYIDAESTKTGQKTFDHQKALEGSTSFDFKNAIGSAEPLTHQVHITPAHVEHLGKQTLTYIVPKIPILPTPVPMLDNHIHETVLEKHPSKHFGYGGLVSKHPTVSVPELSGKYISSPHTVMWTYDHLKHGNDYHQPLVNLHLPKQELIKHTKVHQVEIPTSYISHQPVSHHKTPLVIHHEAPVLKYTQDFHLPKKLPQVQHVRANHVKSLPMTNIDWSLYNSKVPNFNMNAILLKPDLLSFMSEPGKKIIPILVKKRKNRSSKDVEAIIYGKTTGNRGPVKPNHRNDKAVKGSIQQEGNRFVGKGDGNNEFSVSASYKVDRSLQTVSK